MTTSRRDNIRHNGRYFVKNDFREITIPGDILEDENISDGAKIIYGKIARLSFKTGFCWASNEFLGGARTSRTAARQIKELIDAGYIESRIDDKGIRQLRICEVNSKIENDHDKNVAPPMTKMSYPHDKNVAPPHDKNVIQTDQDITNLKNKEKKTEDFLSDDKPIEKREDATIVFQKAREYWNEKGLKPECRDLIIRPVYISDILRTFQQYTWEEIKNAIGNYAWHKKQSRSEYLEPPPYGSLYGFLNTGVDRYFDDSAIDQQFKKEVKN